MEPLQVLLFGGFELRRGSETAPPIPSRPARSMFAFLAVNRDVRHPRERLAEQFWPDLPATRARRRLSHALWQVQDALGELVGEVPYLEASADTVAFVPEGPLWVDVEDFERRFEQVRERRAGGRSRPGDLPDLEEIVDLYRGDFLSGHYEDWVAVEQQRLEQRYLEALTWLVALAKGQGAYDDALLYARRLTNQDPLREEGHREVMRLSMLLGRTSDAIRQYERCHEVLAEELGTEPAASTTQLYKRIVRQRDLGAGKPSLEPTPFPDRLPLVGRDRERMAAVAVLEQALAGHGGTVLVEADPGVGKSRLISEVIDDAHWRGFTVVHATSRGPESPAPYAVVQELLTATLTPLRVEQLRHRVDAVWLAQAATLFPTVKRSLPENLPAVVLRDAEGAQRMRDALVRIVTALADLDPLIVAVDDLHWSDDESLAVLEAVATGAAERPLVVLVGYRGDHARARSAVWETIRGIDRRTRPERLLLGPLDALATAELVRVVGRGHSVDPAVIARLRHETGGNPLFVIETLRALAEQQLFPELEHENADHLPLPGSIRELIVSRLSRLPEEARAVLDAAAVGGDGIDLDTLIRVTELPAASVADAADLLVRSSFLREVGDAFGLHHDQIRRVAVAVMSDGARRSVHVRIADALEELHPDQLERLAHHYAEAGVTRKAVAYLQRAGRAAAAVHAYGTADVHYRRALGLQGSRPASVAARFDLLAEHEAVLDVLGVRERQRQVVEEMKALAEGDRRREVEASRRYALLQGELGNLERALESAREARAGADEIAEAELRGACFVTLASVLTWAGRREEAVPLLTEGAELAAGAAAEAEVRAMLGSVLRELQRYEEAADQLDVALDVAVDHGHVREEAQILSILGTVRMETCDVVGAEELYRRAIDRCRRVGFRRGEGISLVNHANALAALGHTADAIDAYHEADAVFADLGDRRGEAMVALNRGHVRHAVLGDDLTATRDARTALEFFETVDDPRWVADSLGTLARVALRAGHLTKASTHLERAFEQAARIDDAWLRAQLLSIRADHESASGQLDAALASIRAAIELVMDGQPVGFSDLRPALLAAEGRVLLVLGRADDALAATSRAVELLHDGVERRYLVLDAHRHALAACDRPREAVEVGEAAATELDRVLSGLTERDRRRALAVSEHRDLTRHVQALPDRRDLQVAAADAPIGRPLSVDEMIEVPVDLTPTAATPEDPVERRRWRLDRVIEQVLTAGGIATVADLASVLKVSEATVRRDLQVLRGLGRDLPTRGRRTG